MVIKSADDRSEDIAELKRLLATELTRYEREAIEDELNNIQKDARDEKNAAYYLNLYFGNSDRHLVLHDLQIVLSDGRTALIDHLLVNSFQDFYVLESKNWDQLTVEKSGACTTGNRQIIEAESPLAQCKRHAGILARALQIDPQLKKLVPRPKLIPRVVVPPGCQLAASDHKEWFVKADIFSRRAKKDEKASIVKNVLELPRSTSRKSLAKIGQALLELHNLKPINWRGRFGLLPLAAEVETPANKQVSRTKSLTDHVPSLGNNWFVLTSSPNKATKKLLKAAGYHAKKEHGALVWRLKG